MSVSVAAASGGVAAQSSQPRFSLAMTIAEAIAVHDRVAGVLAAFHLGGCAHCSNNQVDTLQQVCESYRINLDELLAALEAAVPVFCASMTINQALAANPGARQVLEEHFIVDDARNDVDTLESVCAEYHIDLGLVLQQLSALT